MTPGYLTPDQARQGAEFRAFADRELVPRAAGIDAGQAVTRETIAVLAEHRYLGSAVPAEQGGGGLGMVAYGLLAEEIGRACQSARNFVAVQDMVVHSLLQWGSDGRRERWLGPLLGGTAVAAFALTEPGVGSDAGAVTTTARPDRGGYRLDGTKKWISFAQIADVFLVFADLDGKHTAFLVERDTPGLSVAPITGLLGLRGSLLGEITLDGCVVPGDSIVGRPGLGLAFVASGALDLGRYSTACGAVGLAEACLRACATYTGERAQYGTEIRNHQLVQAMLADLVTDTTAARLLCYQAGVSREQGSVEAVNHTLMAKYRASTVAVRAASDAVQLHGASGIGDSAVQRHYRDAKVLEIIEGTTQIQQTLLGQYAARVGAR
ncbi:hypothetical protein FHS29_007217 [Saccharothrix tamanrassetensis]|uniref:Acyl-CoA dehydrogenase n=1 Tax=Saccharothrix tamanrassetensis TaxID=1051531 RepID=A0A841CTG5_9PSEU|nr:acyl-CoA dehydrogenase family protein [Saccharothrix tamanrassetensis]MBB5960589.1 hypothetical protein [Saccharothrix tamanrassetensis]